MSSATTVGAVLRAGAATLRAAGVPGAARDARVLMAGALGAGPGGLSLAEPEALPAAARAAFAAMVAARARRQPVAQILGRRAFWGREFAVTPDVLDPRPETETLIACALSGPPAGRVLDLGTGSGALLLTLLAEWPSARGLGTDTSAPALGIASRNAATLGLADRARFVQADWLEGLAERFDLAVCNPPYIPAADLAVLEPDVRDWEPAVALSPGPTGLEAYARIAAGLHRVLSPGARALFEIGAGQVDTVAATFRAAGLTVLGSHADLDGRPRVLAITGA